MTDLTLSGPALIPASESRITEATLYIEHGIIARVTPDLDASADIVTGGYIAPGFIDLQINGAFGADFTSDGRTVIDVAARLPATGVTSFLPTIITAPFEAYPKLLHDVGEAIQSAAGAHALGVHLEGPYLNPRRSGAHNPALLRPVDVDEIVRWADNPIVRLVTLAPELPGASEAIKALRRRGVVVSAGHSDAAFAEAMAGFEAGITWGTHLFNGMRELGHREPGLPGALLWSSVPCGLIADGVHVHPAVVKLAFCAKGADGLTLVTDAIMAMGISPGHYKLGDREVMVDDTVARLDEKTLAGSILTMDQAVRNTVVFTSCSPAEALTMATATPAHVLGLEHKGRIIAGYDADLVVLDEALRVTHTVVAGKLVHTTQQA
jgi:N-acetylglucosamine-6-phosphate deacetylase